MTGIEYLKNNLDETSEILGFDVKSLSEGIITEEDSEKLKRTINSTKDLLNLNDKEKEKIQKRLEENPQEFERDLSKFSESNFKKMKSGDLQYSFMDALQKALLGKKTSKSKYTRKKKK